jgi:hypothetical protein
VLWPISLKVLVLSFLCGIIYICLIDNSYYHQLDGDYMIKSLGLLFLTLSVCGGCVVGVSMRNNDIGLVWQRHEQNVVVGC